MFFLHSWLLDYCEPDAERARRLREEFANLLNEDCLRLTGIGLAVEGAPRLLESSQPAVVDDAVIDLEVTSNRPDVMCHVGLARELAVALGVPLRQPKVPSYGSFSSDGTGDAVRLEDREGCPRLVARILRGVRVGPSPEWLVRRLEALGLRSINNVVDATNYVLWELGQPLHGYDLATVPDGELHVRRARAGERLTTLDGVDRALDSEILVIADRQRAIGLAGIMGGLDTEVTASTTDILLESAHFDRRRIRIGAKRLGLHTDASHRFERGVDFELCDLASRRCAALIVELAGGEVVEPAVDAIARRPEMPVWTLDAAALERFAGCGVGDEEIERILGGLGFAPEALGERRWRGRVPSWREVDFEPRREGERVAYAQDLYEEVLRHVGLDRVPATLPPLGGADSGVSAAFERRRRVRRLLAGFGYVETIHFAFHDAAWDAAYPALLEGGAPVRLANPLSERFALMRRSLVPNLVATAEFNAHRGAEGIRLVELGHLFPGGDAPELDAVGFVAGGVEGGAWDRRPESDLLALKGDCEALFAELGMEPPALRSGELPGVAAGTGGRWIGADGTTLGWLGRLERTDVGFPLFAAELRLDLLPVGGEGGAVMPPPRLPGIRADFTLTHALSLDWRELAAAIDEHADELRVGYELKDRYRGAGVPDGAVATTITFDYNGGDRSLTQDEVNRRQAALAATLERQFGIGRGRA